MRIAFGVVDVLLAALALLTLLPVGILLTQLVAALPMRRSSTSTYANDGVVGSRPRLAVLMPAHNEAGGIGDSIAAVKAQLHAKDRLVVVADNCSDDTARIAAACGAEVAVRVDAERRGKGYALDFGVRWLKVDPPEVVIIVDADCLVHAGALEQLARACVTSRRPIQSLYLMRSAADSGLKTRIAEFAWKVKNHARPLGNLRLGLPCQLMGSGMAFTWTLIQNAPLASGHLVEDLQLGLDLTARGAPPFFCEAALVTSVFPLSEAGLTAQRTRWEHGYLGVIVAQGPRLLRQAISGARLGPIFIALDLCVPPLASLALWLVSTVMVATAWWAIGGSAWPVGLLGLDFALLSLAVLLGWWRFGRGVVSGRDLLSAPLYAAAKVPMYLRALRQRQAEWVRTQRDNDQR